ADLLAVEECCKGVVETPHKLQEFFGAEHEVEQDRLDPGLRLELERQAGGIEGLRACQLRQARVAARVNKSAERRRSVKRVIRPEGLRGQAAGQKNAVGKIEGGVRVAQVESGVRARLSRLTEEAGITDCQAAVRHEQLVGQLA